jgi:hypothetical protein
MPPHAPVLELWPCHANHTAYTRRACAACGAVYAHCTRCLLVRLTCPACVYQARRQAIAQGTTDQQALTMEVQWLLLT